MALQAMLLVIPHFSVLNYQANKSSYCSILERDTESQKHLLNYKTKITNFTTHKHTHRGFCWEEDEEVITLPEAFLQEMSITCIYIYIYP